MNKWWVIALIIGVLIAIILALSIYIYYINYTTDKNTIKSKELADEIKEAITNEEVVTTSSKEAESDSQELNNEKKQYKLKEHNGVIGIFEMNLENNEIFIKDTEIQTRYLPELDLVKLKDGIIVDSEEELNSTLEDFE